MIHRRLTSCLLLAALALSLWRVLDAFGTIDVGRSASHLRLEMGYPPGRGPDGLASAIAYELGRALEQRVGVVPWSGAQIPSADDGHLTHGDTLLVASADAISLAPLLASDAERERSAREWCPLMLVGQTPHVLVVTADSQIDSVAELVDSARRNPGVLSYASLGTGSTTDVIADAFIAATTADMTRVPYRSSATALRDVLGGNVTAMFATLQSVLPALEAGEVRALAVASARRSARAPDAPTFAELGWPAIEAPAWYGLFARCGLADERQRLLLRAASEALVHTHGGTAGLDMESPPIMDLSFARFLDRERARWSALLEIAQDPRHAH